MYKITVYKKNKFCRFVEQKNDNIPESPLKNPIEIRVVTCLHIFHVLVRSTIVLGQKLAQAVLINGFANTILILIESRLREVITTDSGRVA